MNRHAISQSLMYMKLSELTAKCWQPATSTTTNNDTTHLLMCVLTSQKQPQICI